MQAKCPILVSKSFNINLTPPSFFFGKNDPKYSSTFNLRAESQAGSKFRRFNCRNQNVIELVKVTCAQLEGSHYYQNTKSLIGSPITACYMSRKTTNAKQLLQFVSDSVREKSLYQTCTRHLMSSKQYSEGTKTRRSSQSPSFTAYY